MTKLASKGKKRIDFLNELMSILKHDDIYEVIDYKNQKEDKIKQFMYPKLLQKLEDYYHILSPKTKKEKLKEKAKKTLLWEGNKKTTVKNMLFLGTQHRPDMVIDGDLSIAVEIKRGESGSNIREGIGQAIVYSTVYDFVIYLFIDTSKDKKIKNSITSVKEKNIIEGLWINYNVMFDVV